MNKAYNFIRKCKLLLLIMIVIIIKPMDLFGGITGKISGRVIDASTGEPLPGASIVIQGTTMGAASDADGYYFIINVPPGEYRLIASMIGYEKVEVTNVNVSSDHTTIIDFSLKPTEVQIEEVIIVAPKEIIKKDVTSTQIVARASQIDVLPGVRDINQFVNLQAGILSNEIRAGGLDQIGYLVNGAVSVDNRTNQPLSLVNLSTVSEVTIMKGGFDAEYGNVRSGVINVVTKDPDSKKYNVYADFRYTPARQKHNGASIFSPDNFYNRPYLDPGVCWVGTKNGTWDEYTQRQNLEFEGWNAVSQRLLSDQDPSNDMTPEEARERFIWQRTLEGSDTLGQKPRKYGHLPDFSVDISISGGVPIIGESLGEMAFLASFSTNWQAYRFPTSRDYYKNSIGQLKLTSRTNDRSMKFGFEVSYGEIHTIAGSVGGGTDNDYVGSGSNQFGGGNDVTSYVAWWPEAIVPFNIYRSLIAFSFDHILSKNTFYTIRASRVNIKNYANMWGDNALRDTTVKRYFGNVPVDEQPYGWWFGNGTPIYDQGGSIYSADAAGHRDFGSVTTYNIRFDLTSQLDKYNQFKTGFEFNYDDIRTDYARMRLMAMWETFRENWNHYPYRIGAYIQDKLEFEGMIARFGIRLDYNEPNSDWFLNDPYSKYFTRKYKDLLLSEAPTEPAKGHVKISPRLGISHPIGENVKLYFTYTHNYSLPSSNRMYRIEWGRGSDGIRYLGNPNADIPRTIAYELGVEWDIAGEVLLQLSGYYKNTDNEINEVEYTNYTSSVDYRTYQNNHYSDVRGFEIQLIRNLGPWVTGLANYTYQVESYGNTGRNHYFEDQRLQVIQGMVDPNITREQIRPFARVALQFFTPSNWGPEIFGIRLFSDWIISPFFSYRAGEYVTWNPLGLDGVRNNLQYKPSWNVNLRISKKFNLDKMSVELYGDISNLLYNKIISGNGNAGFYNQDDRDEYYKTLHLPMYNDPRFDSMRDYKMGYYIPGNDQPGDIRSDEKPYIDMPNRDFLTFTAQRYVTFGLRINFN